MSLNVEIKLSRISKIYIEGEVLRGTIQVINTGSDAKYDAIVVAIEGNITLQFGNRNAGPFEAFTNSAKTVPLMGGTGAGPTTWTQISPAGHFTAGLNEFEFEFPLTAGAGGLRESNGRLYETYHGVFVAINYAIRCEVRRSFLAKSIAKTQTFILQNRPVAPPRTAEDVLNFTISPESMLTDVSATAGGGGGGGGGSQPRVVIPRFLITGRLDRSEWCVTKPITGHLTVQHTEVAIKSIECQLIRVETSGGGDSSAAGDATEIQNIQIVDGNVCAKLPIPIHMILPRLFLCPSLRSKSFRVDFEMNLVIAFQDNYCVTENFKLPLNRFAW